MAYRSLLTLIVLTQPVLLLQTGCAHYEPLEVRKDSRIQEGPGLFSGEKGYFNVSTDIKLSGKTFQPKAKPAEEAHNTRRPLDTKISDSND